MKDETLRTAFRNWEELSMTQEQYLAYESRLKGYRGWKPQVIMRR